MASEERMRMIKRNGGTELEQKLLTTASWDNGIKTDVVVVVIKPPIIILVYIWMRHVTLVF